MRAVRSNAGVGGGGASRYIPRVVEIDIRSMYRLLTSSGPKVAKQRGERGPRTPISIALLVTVVRTGSTLRGDRRSAPPFWQGANASRLIISSSCSSNAISLLLLDVFLSGASATSSRLAACRTHGRVPEKQVQPSLRTAVVVVGVVVYLWSPVSLRRRSGK